MFPGQRSHDRPTRGWQRGTHLTSQRDDGGSARSVRACRTTTGRSRWDPLGATFLWLSDMPELNEQSRRRLVETSDVFRAANLVLVDHETFDQETFTPGKIYFLNTQKVGRDR